MFAEEIEKFALPVGLRVEVELGAEWSKKGENKKKRFSGKIIASDKRHFTVQGPLYCMSFLKIDLYLGEIRLHCLEDITLPGGGKRIVSGREGGGKTLACSGFSMK